MKYCEILRISRWWQRNIKPSWGPSEHGALCDCTGHTPVKLALLGIHTLSWRALLFCTKVSSPARQEDRAGTDVAGWASPMLLTQRSWLSLYYWTQIGLQIPVKAHSSSWVVRSIECKILVILSTRCSLASCEGSQSCSCCSFPSLSFSSLGLLPLSWSSDCTFAPCHLHCFSLSPALGFILGEAGWT